MRGSTFRRELSRRRNDSCSQVRSTRCRRRRQLQEDVGLQPATLQQLEQQERLAPHSSQRSQKFVDAERKRNAGSIR